MIRLTDFPEDILEDIFHAMRNLLCFPGEQDYSDPEVTRLGSPLKRSVPLWANVIILSHVCSHWRSLMRTRPRLWTFIRVTGTFKNRLMVNEMLERSNPFPLSVLFTNRAETVAEGRDDSAVFDIVAIASILSDHSERFQELGIALYSKHVAMVMNALSTAAVPRLEKLWFHCGLEGSTGGGKSEVFSTPLFDNMVPPLRVLHMDHIKFSWLPFENLEHLELTGGPAPPLPALLHTLRHSPLLVTLILQIPGSVKSEEVDEAVEGETRIMLPCLRLLDLRVGSTYSHAFSILPYIAFPQTTAVLLSFSCRFTSSLYEHCDSLQDIAAAIEHASLVIRPPNIAHIFSEQSSLQLMYQVSQCEDPDVSQQPIARLSEGFRAVPLPSLTSLSLRTESMSIEYTRLRFVDLLQTVPTITHLALDVRAAEAVALFEGLGELVGGEGGEKVSICPRLKDVSVNMRTWPTDDDFWCLERCCHARASAGVPIERLETLKFPETVLSSLQHSVQTIIVKN